MSEEKLKELIKENLSDGRLACRHALKIANELGVSPASVGKMCNYMEIKIASCQLGCFK